MIVENITPRIVMRPHRVIDCPRCGAELFDLDKYDADDNGDERIYELEATCCGDPWTLVPSSPVYDCRLRDAGLFDMDDLPAYPLGPWPEEEPHGPLPAFDSWLPPRPTTWRGGYVDRGGFLAPDVEGVLR